MVVEILGTAMSALRSGFHSHPAILGTLPVFFTEEHKLGMSAYATAVNTAGDLAKAHASWDDVPADLGAQAVAVVGALVTLLAEGAVQVAVAA